MKLESYLDNMYEGNVTYSYTRKHTKKALLPDNKCEKDSRDVYTKSNGNLFYNREVSWNSWVILNESIDINVNLDGRKFIDRVEIDLGDNSVLKKIEVLTNCEEGVKKIGVFSSDEYLRDKNINITIGYFCDNVIVRIFGMYEDISIQRLDIFGVSDIENCVYPIPDNAEYTGDVLKLSSVSSISPACPEAAAAAEYLAEKLGIPVGENGNIELVFSPFENDSYEVETTPQKSVIKAGNKRAFFYGVCALVQLLNGEGFKTAKISDSPAMDIRGVHIALPSRCDIPFLKRVIKEMWVPLRYNTVFIQLSGAMRYNRFPEINEMWLKSCQMYEDGKWPLPAHYNFIGHDILEKDEIRDICDYIRSFGIEIVPEIQSFSHSQYITTAYPHLAEMKPGKTAEITDLTAADAKPSEFYHHNMCPCQDDYYDVIFGLIDEVLEVIEPENYIHMGHDELYEYGHCEKCSKKELGALFADEVNRLNAYIKSKGKKMMMWADMLQSMRYAIMESINLIDKDVIMLDFIWYYNFDKDFEDNLLNHGFKVMLGNMYSSHYTRYDSRSKKEGVIGAQISTWVNCNENSYAFEGKMYDFVYSANMMWSKKFKSAFRRTYGEIIKPVIWKMRQLVGEIDLSGNIEKAEIGGNIKDVPTEILWQSPFDAALSLESGSKNFATNSFADVILFTHATDKYAERVMWQSPKEIGEYVINYADGTNYNHALLYGENIFEYGKFYGEPIPGKSFRHEGYIGTYMAKPICGKDNSGRDYTLYKLPVKNPHPDKKIESITLKHNENYDVKILLFDVELVKN